MCLVKGRHVGVREERLRQLPQEGLDEGGHVVGRGVPQGGVCGGRGGVEVGVQRTSKLLYLGPEGEGTVNDKAFLKIMNVSKLIENRW